MNSKKRLSLLIIGATVTSLMGGTVSTYAADNTETTEPLTIAEQGIFSAGGITITSDGTFNPEDQWEETGAGQTSHVDHANVLYQIPEEETSLPMVFLHGYGQSRMGWMTTPDGREGWALNRNKMVKNIMKNTILTDFLKIVDDDSAKKSASKTARGAIKRFDGYIISAEKDSLSYMVMVSPYLSMLKTGSFVPAGEFNIAIDKLENALKNAKGYYEFVGTKGKSKVILRFNINSFKNGYTISDLLKMNLSIYAIKVGRTSLDMLDVSKELEMDVSIIPKDNPSYEGSNEVEDNAASQKILDVFDVLLAGVEAVD